MAPDSYSDQQLEHTEGSAKSQTNTLMHFVLNCDDVLLLVNEVEMQGICH